jgi:putative addiction module killer protein
MYEIRESDEYRSWVDGLRDRMAKAKVVARSLRLAQGNAGDVKPIRDGVSELRIDHGPGYRVYFSRKGPVLLLLLCGGDKRTQSQDIERAIRINREWRPDQ